VSAWRPMPASPSRCRGWSACAGRCPSFLPIGDLGGRALDIGIVTKVVRGVKKLAEASMAMALELAAGAPHGAGGDQAAGLGGHRAQIELPFP